MNFYCRIYIIGFLWTNHYRYYVFIACSLIQAQLGTIPIQEFGLTQDTGRIFKNGMRISKCMLDKSGIANKQYVFFY